MSNFSDRVRKLRKSYGLSQERFAKRMGISRDYLSQLENGRTPSKALQVLIETFERSGIGDADSVVNKYPDKETKANKIHEDGNRISSKKSGPAPSSNYLKPTRAELEADFSTLLDMAEEAGALTYVKIQMSKFLDPSDLEHLKR